MPRTSLLLLNDSLLLQWNSRCVVIIVLASIIQRVRRNERNEMESCARRSVLLVNPLPHERRELVRVRVCSPRLVVRDAHTLEHVAHQLLPVLVLPAAADVGDQFEQMDSRFSFARDAFDVRFLSSLCLASLADSNLQTNCTVYVYSYT